MPVLDPYMWARLQQKLVVGFLRYVAPKCKIVFNKQPRRTWKKEVITYFKVLLRHLSGEWDGYQAERLAVRPITQPSSSVTRFLISSYHHKTGRNQGRERCNWQTDSRRWHLNYCVKVWQGPLCQGHHTTSFSPSSLHSVRLSHIWMRDRL
jgi:hypothetical protein